MIDNSFNTVEKTNIGNCQATVCDRYQVKINIKIRKNQDKYKASFRYTIQLLHLKNWLTVNARNRVNLKQINGKYVSMSKYNMCPAKHLQLHTSCKIQTM